MYSILCWASKTIFYVLSLLQQSTILKQPFVSIKYYSEAVGVLFETFVCEL